MWRRNASPWTDLLWLFALALLLIATGIGLRDPWPPDEPRFALVARDMLATGDWLLPRVGGQAYADKPPLFFWLVASGLEVTHSLRIAFLLPSFLAAFGCVALVYDLGRRLWNREAGLAGALALLFTVQFVWQARQAQIDATLCFWTTLSLYGLLRHLLLGPSWRWYTIGWAAAGLGVITKGVGFLPLLILVPFALLRDPRWQPRKASGGGARWLLGPLAFLAAISIWLVPMLLAASDDPTLAAYRDEILFEQTLTRYGNAWHHREPFWYFLVEVIPALWLPLTLLVPWLFVHWRDALRSFDLRIALLASWIVLVVLFFSFSTGKRGVYVLPAVPALALLCAPYLAQVATRRGAQRAMFILAAVASGLCAATWIYLLVRPDRRADDRRSVRPRPTRAAHPDDDCGRCHLCDRAPAPRLSRLRQRDCYGVAHRQLLGESAIERRALGRVVRRAHRASCRSAARARPGRVQRAIRFAGAPPDRALRSCALARS